MPANPINTIVQITQEQFDRAALLFGQIQQANDRVSLGTLAERRKLIARRTRLTKERQALLAISGEQYEALKRWADNPRWKSQLRAAWSHGVYGSRTNNDAALLQQIRNERGVMWLENFRLPGR